MNVTIRLAKLSDAYDMANVLIRSWDAAYKDIMPAEYIKAKNASRFDRFKRTITDENVNTYVIQYDEKL